MSLQTPKDLGAGQTGYHDWYWQRVTAALLLIITPVIVGLVFAIYAGKIDFLTLNHWFGYGLGKSLATIALAVILLHTWTGLRVIFEDYVHFSSGRVFVLNVLLLGLILVGLYMTYHIWAEISYPFSCIPCTPRGN